MLTLKTNYMGFSHSSRNLWKKKLIFENFKAVYNNLKLFWCRKFTRRLE